MKIELNFFSHPDMTIHTPIVSRNVMFLNFFELISGQNNPKNSVKMRLFNVSKNHLFDLKSLKNELLVVTFEGVLAVL